MHVPGEKPLTLDTAATVEALRVRAFRAMPPKQKLARVMALNRAVRKLAIAGIRQRHGADIPGRELKLRLAALSLPREIMIRVFGWDPQQEGY